MLRERVARREHVAVELDAALRHAGGAAGEGDDARVVAAVSAGGSGCSEAVRVSSSPFP
jgi:hypothetical protein